MNPHRQPALGFLLLVSAARLAAIDIVDFGATGDQVDLGGTYTQNFDNLLSVTPPGGASFNKNSTIPGWYSTQAGYGANWISGGLGSYGTGSDRALGGAIANWELRFVNTSSLTISGFSASYDVEQWYRAANSPQVTNTLQLYYRTYSASVSEFVEVGNILSAGWTHIPDATFTSPNADLTTAAFVDGNLPENQGHVSFSIHGISLTPGQKLWLRWITFDEPGNDHAFGTDNVSVSFSAIPEPATFAALLGMGSLALTATRRRPR